MSAPPVTALPVLALDEQLCAMAEQLQPWLRTGMLSQPQPWDLWCRLQALEQRSAHGTARQRLHDWVQIEVEQGHQPSERYLRRLMVERRTWNRLLDAVQLHWRSSRGSWWSTAAGHPAFQVGPCWEGWRGAHQGLLLAEGVLLRG